MGWCKACGCKTYNYKSCLVGWCKNNVEDFSGQIEALRAGRKQLEADKKMLEDLAKKIQVRMRTQIEAINDDVGKGSIDDAKTKLQELHDYVEKISPDMKHEGEADDEGTSRKRKGGKKKGQKKRNALRKSLRLQRLMNRKILHNC